MKNYRLLVTSAWEVLYTLLLSVCQLADLCKCNWLDLHEKNEGLCPTYIASNFESDPDHCLHKKNIEDPDVPIYLFLGHFKNHFKNQIAKL